jgi:CDP-paratose 2-epimerase
MYIGFGGDGYQVRDAMHPRDLIPLLQKQTVAGATAPVRVVNLGGGAANAMSLAQLSSWCRDRYGDHTVGSKPEIRRFDVPWLIMDATLAGDIWGWRPQTAMEEILDEIAVHAEKNPDWLELSGLL